MSRTRRAALAAGALVLAAAAAGGWVLVRGLDAEQELTAAEADLTTAREALLDQRFEEAERAVVAAGARTRRATELTSDPVFRLTARIPLAGRTVHVARELAAAADVVARDLLPDALEVADQVDVQTLRTADGRVDVARLRAAAPGVSRLAELATRLSQETSALPRALVAPQVGEAREDLDEQLRELADALTGASRGVALAPALLGDDRPRRYFVLVQQTSESRGTGGLPGGFAILEADKGRLRVVEQGANDELRNGAVPPPPGVDQDFVDIYQREGAFDLWVNVNVSPDLPNVARVVAAKWRAQGGAPVDGVIALDALALADILTGSGPIDLGDRQISAAELPDYLAIGQYADFAPLQRQKDRKDKLAAAALAASRRITSGGGSTSDLVRGVARAVGSGHLRMASDDPQLSGPLSAAGVTGALPTGPEPVVYPVVYNSSGGKLDHFLDRSVAYEAGDCVDGRRPTTITVDLRNSAPATGLPPYVRIFNDAGVQTLTYDNAVTLSVYGTRGALLESAVFDGKPIGFIRAGAEAPFLFEESEDGLPVWSLFVDLPRAQTKRLVLRLDEPAVAGEARILEQPLARPLSVTNEAKACS